MADDRPDFDARWDLHDINRSIDQARADDELGA